MTGETPYAFVAVGRPVRGEFTYAVPPELQGLLKPGQRIRVPFGRSVTLGFYLGPAPEPPPEVVRKLRPIERILDPEAAFPPDIVELVRFAAQHYRYPLGEALRAALPPGLTKADDGKTAKADVTVFARALPEATLEPLTRAPAQHATLSYLLAVGGRAPVEEIAHAIPGAKENLKKLAARGYLQLEEERVVKGVREGLQQSRPDALTPEQEIAVGTLTKSLDAGGFAPFLLHGVTGSGKRSEERRVGKEC